jgi:hypothetical protein
VCDETTCRSLSESLFGVEIPINPERTIEMSPNFDGHYVSPLKNSCRSATQLARAGYTEISNSWQVERYRGETILMCTSIIDCLEVAHHFGFTIEHDFRPAQSFAFRVYTRDFLRGTDGTLVQQTLIAQTGSAQFGACHQRVLTGTGRNERL